MYGGNLSLAQRRRLETVVGFQGAQTVHSSGGSFVSPFCLFWLLGQVMNIKRQFSAGWIPKQEVDWLSA